MKIVNPKLFASWLIPLPLLIELFLYAFTPFSNSSFRGIQKAPQAFRDLYVLTLNHSCNIPVNRFRDLGSCSDLFYGIPPGNFDYPLPLFSFIKLLPYWNHEIVGFLEGSIFVVLVAFVCHRIFSNPLVIILVLYGYPTRYLIERGQVDLITWILALFSVFLLFSLSTIQNSAPRDRAIISLSAFFLFLSALVKGFTLPSLFIFSVYLKSKYKISKIYLVPLLLTVAASFILFTPHSLPGHHSTAVQIMPGEIFGLLVSIPSHLTSAEIVYLLSIKISAALLTLIWLLLNERHESTIDSGYSLSIDLFAIISSTTYLAFYFLTVSANYKLVAASFLLILVTRDFLCFTGHQSLKSKKANDVKTLRFASYIPLLATANFTCSLSNIFPLLLVASPLVFNYRPYIPGLQFTTQYFFDFFICPSIAGVALYYLFVALQSSTLSKSTQARVS